MSRRRPRAKSDEQSRTKRSPTDLYDAASRHFLSKRYGPAEDRCRQALTLDPKHADSLYLLGLVHAQTNRLDLAIDLIVSAVRCNPNNHEYFLNLGELLQHQNKLDEARKSFDLAIKLAPNLAVGWIKLGNLLRIQRRYDEVLLTYEHAFTLDPNNADAAACSNCTGMRRRSPNAIFRWPFPRIRLKFSVSKVIACAISVGLQRQRLSIGGPPS
jgi:tetratricopeptide (TPR) repeat protein